MASPAGGPLAVWQGAPLLVRPRDCWSRVRAQTRPRDLATAGAAWGKATVQTVRRDSQGQDWSSELGALLAAARSVVLVSERGPHPDLVVAAPHHAPAGLRTIATPPRAPDLHTGHLAAALADLLGARLVVACVASGPDPNKRAAAAGAYQQALFAGDPRLVVELHGMRTRAGRADVEVACGEARLARPVELAQALAGRLAVARRTAGPGSTAAADEPPLRLAAAGAGPLLFAGRSNHVLHRCAGLAIPAYQIETVRRLRLTEPAPADPSASPLPALGSRFVAALAEALLLLHPSSLVCENR